MSLDALLTLTATLPRVSETGPEDAHGNPSLLDGDDVTVACYLEQLSASENDIGRATQISDHLLIVPAGTVLSGDDTVVIDGETYIVVGPPWEVVHPPDGAVHHIEAHVRLIVG